MSQAGWRLVVKVLLDRIVATSGLVLLSPVLAGVAIAVGLVLGRPVLFRQERSGRGGRRFHIVKFRTMAEAHDEDGRPLPDDQRLTRLGRALRALSIDELPELWNVARGEMSLVGPRPLPSKYDARYSPEQARRLQVLPGITGWAQVNGRNATSWEERFTLDLWYVDNWSLGLDARILCRTVTSVAGRSGISFAGHATMPEFGVGGDGDPSLPR
jgi:lipopolysaccharide/colanic/teichoic acid biosynthesis glycosyltransferase